MNKVVLFEKYKSSPRVAESKTAGLSQYPTFKRFIRGPISFAWITKASKISPSALSVGVVLWYWYGLTGSLTVRLTTKRLREFGISRTTAYWAVAKLEKAGLVSVDRKYGRAPLVRILVNI